MPYILTMFRLIIVSILFAACSALSLGNPSNVTEEHLLQETRRIIEGGCLVELRSHSFNNEPPSEQYAHIKINGKLAFYSKYEALLNFRGLNTMVLDVSTCEAREWRWFETFQCPDVTCSGEMFSSDQRVTGGAAAFIDYYTNHVSEGTVLLGVTADDPIQNLGPALPTLKAAGVDVDDLEIAGMFAFVMKSKGDPARNVYIKQQSQPSAITMSVLIQANIDLLHTGPQKLEKKL